MLHLLFLAFFLFGELQKNGKKYVPLQTILNN